MEIVLVILIGLAVGSFLNVVIYRTRSQKKITGRSECRFCGKLVRWSDNIPVISSLLLRARCRNCQKFFGWQYALVELGTALIFLELYFKFGLNSTFGFLTVLSSFLILIFVYDFRWSLIPDHFSLPAVIVAIGYQFSLKTDFQDVLVAALIGGGFFAVQYALSRGRWIGSGDIRLGLLMGIILGWQMLLVALFIAYLAGALIGLIMMAAKRKKLKSEIPFGTFLTAATFVSLLWGQGILDWYLNFLNF